jgi:acyl-CoA thioesterase FadM
MAGSGLGGWVVRRPLYFTYFEWARTSMWLELTGRTECDFHHQVSMEPIEIRVRIGDMRTTSFDTLCEIRTDGGRQVAARGRVIVVLFDWETQAKMPITDELRKKVRLFQKEAE